MFLCFTNFDNISIFFSNEFYCFWEYSIVFEFWVIVGFFGSASAIHENWMKICSFIACNWVKTCWVLSNHFLCWLNGIVWLFYSTKIEIYQMFCHRPKSNMNRNRVDKLQSSLLTSKHMHSRRIYFSLLLLSSKKVNVRQCSHLQCYGTIICSETIT